MGRAGTTSTDPGGSALATARQLLEKTVMIGSDGSVTVARLTGARLLSRGYSGGCDEFIAARFLEVLYYRRRLRSCGEIESFRKH